LAVYKKTISSNTKDLVGEVKKIKESDLKEGDLVFFNTNGKKYFSCWGLLAKS
jgi:cell wall-associated NlpC family hydrolase